MGNYEFFSTHLNRSPALNEFLGPSAPPSESLATRSEIRGDYDGNGRQEFTSSQAPAPPSGSQATISETRENYDGRQESTSSQDPAPPAGPQTARRETRGDYRGRQEFMKSQGPPAPPFGFQAIHATRSEVRGVFDGRQYLRGPGTPAPPPDPQTTVSETRENFEATTYEFPGPRTTTTFPNYNKRDKRKLWRQQLSNSQDSALPSGSQATRRETRGDYHGRQDFMSSRDPGTTIRFPNYYEGDKRRL